MFSRGTASSSKGVQRGRDPPEPSSAPSYRVVPVDEGVAQANPPLSLGDRGGMESARSSSTKSTWHARPCRRLRGIAPGQVRRRREWLGQVGARWRAQVANIDVGPRLVTSWRWRRRPCGSAALRQTPAGRATHGMARPRCASPSRRLNNSRHTRVRYHGQMCEQLARLRPRNAPHGVQVGPRPLGVQRAPDLLGRRGGVHRRQAQVGERDHRSAPARVQHGPELDVGVQHAAAVGVREAGKPVEEHRTDGIEGPELGPGDRARGQQLHRVPWASMWGEYRVIAAVERRHRASPEPRRCTLVGSRPGGRSRGADGLCA